MTEAGNPDNQADYIVINPSLVIPRTELQFRTSRSSGPGGQHVNKVETRVELLFDVANSPSLNESQRERLRITLQNRLDQDGMLHIVAGHHRSQYRNREEAIVRFVTLLQHALRPRTPRKATRVPRSVREERLKEKHQRGEIKRLRGKGSRGEE